MAWHELICFKPRGFVRELLLALTCRRHGTLLGIFVLLVDWPLRTLVIDFTETPIFEFEYSEVVYYE